ncbi:MAG: hypothetical protein SGJ13_15850 [Actinomycetota bacterium]|nr:hypothetical protein [Actinomycetota bacterium]
MTLLRRWPITLVTAAAAAFVLALGWYGQDFPAQILRIERFRAGAVFWNANWFGGHPTLGYSTLLPALGAVLGVWGIAVASTTASVAAFERLVRNHPRALLATAAFAFGMLANLVVGRLAFALGVAFGLAALATLTRSKTAGGALAVACALSSPVAAVFLGIAFAAWAYTAQRYRLGAALVTAAIAPAAFTSIVFGTGGTYPMPVTTVAWALGLCALVALACDDPTVRLGCALYAVVGTGTFLVASPLGSNVGRLPMLFAAPLLLLADPARTKRLLLAVPVVVMWHGFQITEVAEAAATDLSLQSEYHAGLVDYLDDQPGHVRVEIPFTKHHWETTHVATTIPIARGWERQIDRKLNPEFYDPLVPLDANRYRAWLLRNGVTHVALPDTTFDVSSLKEAELVEGGLDYLTPVWKDEHWDVFTVDGATGLLDGPGILVEATDTRVTVDATSTGQFVVRVHASPMWNLTQGDAVVGATPDGWLLLDVRTLGRVVLEAPLG